jgi:dynein heavy chain
MGNINEFLNMLKNFKKDKITDKTIKEITPFIEGESFNPETMMKCSAAAAGLCSWVLALVNYHKLLKKGSP